VATLEAALAFGLAGVRPLAFRRISLDEIGGMADDGSAPGVALPSLAGRLHCGLGLDLPEAPHAVTATPGALLYGLDLPEAPHAVTLDPSGAVWSWGALYEMTAEAVIEEAWSVTWP
jgi:hypothetical protein